MRECKYGLRDGGFKNKRKEVGSEDGECGMKGWMDDMKEYKNAK